MDFVLMENSLLTKTKMPAEESTEEFSFKEREQNETNENEEENDRLENAVFEGRDSKF